jgi:hypothetical protein
MICISAYFFKGDYTSHRKYTSTPDCDCSRAEDLALQVHVLFTFISGTILNKELISSVPHRPFESLLDTNLAQLGPIFTALNHQRKSLLIRDPLIAATGNSRVGYAIYKVFGTTLAYIVEKWIDSPSVRRAIINGTLQRFFPFWILMSRKSLASSVLEDPHLVLRACYGNYLRYWVFDYPIYALPLPLAAAWLLMVRAFNKIEALSLTPTWNHG